MGRMVDRTHREEPVGAGLVPAQGDPKGRPYEDITGFCKSATLDEIRQHGYVLTPGRYVGADVRDEVNEFFRRPLLRVMEECQQRFSARNREEEILVGMLRVAVPDYPPAAFREALANALIQRDYTRMGAVHVQWYDDRLEISNPGGFPEGSSAG